jgi:hypothetical protein
VARLEEWPYSSWPDYNGLRNGNLCNKEETIKTLGLSNFDTKNFADFTFNKKILERIW